MFTMPLVAALGVPALGSLFCTLQVRFVPGVLPAVNVPLTVAGEPTNTVEPVVALKPLTSPPVPPPSARLTASAGEPLGAIFVNVALKEIGVLLPAIMLIVAGVGLLNA